MRPHLLHVLPLIVAIAGCGAPVPADQITSAYQSRGFIADNVARFHANTTYPDFNIVWVLGTDGRLSRMSFNRANGQMSTTFVDSNLSTPVDCFQPMRDEQTVFVLSSDGELWRENGDWHNRTKVATGIGHFRAFDNGTVFVQHFYDQKLYKVLVDAWGGPQFTEVDNGIPVSQFQPVDANNVYVQDNNNFLYRVSATQSGHTLVESNVVIFHAIDTNTFYAQHRDGTLWRRSGDFGRSQIDANVLSFEASTDGPDIYVLGTDHNLWREFGTFQDRDWIDGNVFSSDYAFRAFEKIVTPGSGYGNGMVYVLGSDRKLWFEVTPYHGPPCAGNGSPPGDGGCCSGLERNQTGVCAPKDPNGCGVTTPGGAPPCCHNKAPCSGSGICVTDPQNGYRYCTPTTTWPGSQCPGGGAPRVYGCKVTDCPYTDGNLASLYACSQSDAESMEQQNNPDCNDISCSAQ
jgi:hypothetical protein